MRRDPTGEVLLHCLPCPGFPRFISWVQENLSIYICPSEYLLQHPEAGDQLRPSLVRFPAKAWLELGFANHSDDWFTLDYIYFHSGTFSLYFSLFYHFHNHFCYQISLHPQNFMSNPSKWKLLKSNDICLLTFHICIGICGYWCLPAHLSFSLPSFALPSSFLAFTDFQDACDQLTSSLESISIFFSVERNSLGLPRLASLSLFKM